MKKILAIGSACVCLIVGVMASTFSLYQSSNEVANGNVSARTYQVRNLSVNSVSNNVKADPVQINSSFSYGFFLKSSAEDISYKYTVNIDVENLNGLNASVEVGTNKFLGQASGDNIHFTISEYFQKTDATTYLFKIIFTNNKDIVIDPENLKVTFSTIMVTDPVYETHDYMFYYNASARNQNDEGYMAAFKYLTFDFNDEEQTNAYYSKSNKNGYLNLVDNTIKTEKAIIETTKIDEENFNYSYGDLNSGHGRNYSLDIKLSSRFNDPNINKTLYIYYDTYGYSGAYSDQRNLFDDESGYFRNSFAIFNNVVLKGNYNYRYNLGNVDSGNGNLIIDNVGDVFVESSSVIKNNLVVLASNKFVCQGVVYGNLKVSYCRDFYIYSYLYGDLDVFSTGTCVLGPDSFLYGDVKITTTYDSEYYASIYLESSLVNGNVELNTVGHIRVLENFNYMNSGQCDFKIYFPELKNKTGVFFDSYHSGFVNFDIYINQIYSSIYIDEYRRAVTTLYDGITFDEDSDFVLFLPDQEDVTFFLCSISKYVA